MFALFKCGQILTRPILKKANNLTKCCFSAATETFVNKARFLEKLKTEKNFPVTLYQNGRYLMFSGNSKVCLNCDDKLLYKEYEDIKKWEKLVDTKIVLLDVLSSDLDVNICLFAINVESTSDDGEKEIENQIQGTFVNVRKCLFILSHQESQYVTHALGLINFCKSLKFCSFCGGSLVESVSGHRKQCSKCNFIQYPITSPVCLTLIEDEKHENVLLVRQGRHPPGMFTCVAGFIEPGESMENNARREVAEEVGVKVDKVEYCVSQHWALPASQFTVGCIATAVTKEIDIDPKEIQGAQWFTAQNLKEALIRTRQLKNLENMDPEKLWAPPQNAVSHNLMVTWLKKYHNFDVASMS